MAAKKKHVQYTTPKGTFRYPHLRKPDHGTDEFPNKEGEFNVQLVLSEKAAEPLIKKLQPIFDKAVEDGEEAYEELKPAFKKKNPHKTNDFYVPEYDDDGNETGNVVFKFKKKYSGEKKDGTKWTAKPPAMFDAKGKPMKADPWGGTVGKVAFFVEPYFIKGQAMSGISLKLVATQIIDLVEGGERSASEYGFGEEEGYEADETFDDETEDDDVDGEDEEDDAEDDDEEEGDF